MSEYEAMMQEPGCTGGHMPSVTCLWVMAARETERPLTVMETGSALEIADEIDYQRSRWEADPDGVY